MVKKSLILSIVFLCSCTIPSKRTYDPYYPTYTYCETRDCYSSKVFSFSDSTKLLIKSCAHQPAGCTEFGLGGVWRKEQNKILIHLDKRWKKHFSHLDGNYFSVSGDYFEILLNEKNISDSSKIFNEIKIYYESQDYKSFFSENKFDSATNVRLKKELIARFIESELSDKYSILVKNPK